MKYESEVKMSWSSKFSFCGNFISAGKTHEHKCMCISIYRTLAHKGRLPMHAKRAVSTPGEL